MRHRFPLLLSSLLQNYPSLQKGGYLYVYIFPTEHIAYLFLQIKFSTKSRYTLSFYNKNDQ